MNNYFYCYSKRMFHFIQAFNISYLNSGINHNTGVKYYVFEKSQKLDDIIKLYNKVKYSIN